MNVGAGWVDWAFANPLLVQGCTKLYSLPIYYVSTCFLSPCNVMHGRHNHLDLQVVWKIAKHHFFQDIQNSFQWATGISLEPHQNFWKKIPTSAVARAVKNFGQNGPLLAGWLSNNKNFVVNLAQTYDEQMLKVGHFTKVPNIGSRAKW